MDYLYYPLAVGASLWVLSYVIAAVTRKKLDFTSKHVLVTGKHSIISYVAADMIKITGGSTGLGLAIAELAVARGKHIRARSWGCSSLVQVET